MTFSTALAALAALTVPGVAHNYSMETVPEVLYRAQLPALLVLPGQPAESRLFPERGAGFQATAFAEGLETVTYTVTHLLLVAPVSTGHGVRSHLPRLTELIDAYFAALSDTVTLGGTLLEPADVRLEPGTFPYGGVTYHGCAFRHTWKIAV